MKEILSGLLAISSIIAINLPVLAQPRQVTINHPGFEDSATGINLAISNYSVYDGVLIVALEATRSGTTLYIQAFAPVKCSSGEAYFQGTQDQATGNFIYPNRDKKPIYIRNFYKSPYIQEKNLVVACATARANGFRLK